MFFLEVDLLIHVMASGWAARAPAPRAPDAAAARDRQ